MVTLCIRYTIDMHKLVECERYAQRWPGPVRRCGGELVGYFLPTKIAGPTNCALALIDFPDLAAYERYGDALIKDSDAKANVDAVEKAGCILVEDRSILQRAY